MSLRILIAALVAFGAVLVTTEPAPADGEPVDLSPMLPSLEKQIPKEVKSSFAPPPELADDFGTYKSLLTFQDGTPVKTTADWQRRRKEILAAWRSMTGSWPALIEKPKIQYSQQEHRDNFTQHRISVEIAPDDQTVEGYLLVPDGDGPFPAVLIVYYDAETGVGLGKELRDFGYQLAKRGFVALSIGTPEFCSLNPPYKPLCKQSEEQPPLQPLSALAYVAANCHNALANMLNVDAERIGIIGHSYGGKWAMFASCLYEQFACAVWSDPGIVFDESRSNINYWEPWYLGYDPGRQRHRGIPSTANPRTGAYKEFIRKNHDLHELHALMAPRPFLVSGGAEDPPKRWKALNHTLAVNTLLGYTNRVAMTNRKSHSPTPESNDQIYAFLEHFLKSHQQQSAYSQAVKKRIPWHPIGLSGGGGMFAPAISPADPNLMMLNCDMSAAYISEDGGRNWRMINHAQLRSDTRCRPGFHPYDPDIIYASSSGRLRISRDRGRTFSPIGDLRDSLYGEIAISPSDPNLMLVGTRNGKCRLSRDAGGTWTACAGPNGQVIGFHFDRTRRGRVMLAATDIGIWRSDDWGKTWMDRTSGLPWKEIQGFAAGSNSSRNIVMLYCTVRSKDENGAFRGGVYRSSDRGRTWQLAMGAGLNTETTKADQWGYDSIAQYKQLLTTDTNPLTVYVMNTSTGFHPPHHETVYRTDDGGRTWRDTFFIDPRFKEYNVAGNYSTASTGQSYKGGDVPFGAAICNTDPDRLILVWSQCYVTHNGGARWFNGHTYPAAGHKPRPGSAWACNGLVVTTTWHYYIDPFQPNRHYIAYTDIGLGRSTDAGKTWIWWDKNSWAPWRNTCYEIAFDPDIPGKMWGAFSNVHDIPNDNIISERHGHNRPGGVCISRNFGASWKHEAQGMPPRPVTSIVLDPKSPRNARTLYAGVFMEGVYKSTDDGKTWTLKKNGLGHPKNMRVYRVALHRDGTLFAIICAKRPAYGKPLAGEGVGLYRSSDGAQTWEKVNTSRLFLYPKDFSVHPQDSDIILVGTCDANWQDKSGGLYRTDDAGKTWQRIGRRGRQTFGGYFHPKHNGWIYMTLTEGAPGAGLWLTRDNGDTWKAFDDLPFSNIQRILFDPSDDAIMYVTTFGGSVWRGPVAPHY